MERFRYTPQSRRELLEVQATVFLFAPDKFVPIPNARPWEKRTLDSSFEELRRGVDHVYRNPRHEAARVKMHELLRQAHAEFKTGHREKARDVCLDFEHLVNQTRP